jgi:hypothetical protein
MASSNYSLYAIPAYWLIALYPHVYAVRHITLNIPHRVSSLPTLGPFCRSLALLIRCMQMRLIKSSNNNNWNNHNPHSIDTAPAYKSCVPTACYARFERAEAAHHNGMENAPFFIGAVVVGNMVGLRACKSLFPPPVECAGMSADSLQRR